MSLTTTVFHCRRQMQALRSISLLAAKVICVGSVALLATCLLASDCAFARGGGGGGGGGGRGGGGGGGRSGGWGGASHGSWASGGSGHFSYGAYGGFAHYGFTGTGGIGGHSGTFGHRFNTWGPQPYWNQWNQSWGAWGGWARPWHWSNWYGGWAGWGYPLYYMGLGSGLPNMYFNSAFGGLPPYLNGADFTNLSVNEITAQLLNDNGTLTPARLYHFQPDVLNDNSSVVVAQPAQSTQQAIKAPQANPQTAQQAAQEVASAFRLGPDADIISTGKVAIYLSNSTYLLVTPKGTLVMDQESGMPIIPLYTDPFMVWQIQSEIKRQSLLLQLVQQKLGSSKELPDSSSISVQKSDEDVRVKKIQAAIDLLTQAASNLGGPGPRPQASQPLVPNAIEILASVWLTRHGKYVVMKLQDGSLAYMDGTELYSDEGKTKLALAYPAKFKSAIEAYLGGLVKDAHRTRMGLEQDKQYAEALKWSLKDILKSAPKAAANNIQSAVSIADLQAPDPSKRMQDDLERIQKRLEAINMQLAEMPKELSASKRLLSLWKKT